jgi:hypothetical protein
MRRHLLIVLALLVAASSCKPPRSPREAAEVRVEGQWRGISVAHGPPLDTGSLTWRLAIFEEQSGKLRGRGVLRSAGTEVDFKLDGLRGEGFITMEFDVAGGPAKFQGSIMDIKTIVGEVMMAADTFPLSLSRVR